MLIPRYKIFACCECISLVAPLFLHTAPHAALLCLHHGHGPPSCPPKHYRFTHRQRTRFATWLGRLGTRRRDGSIHCLSVLGLLLRLLLMQLLAWWLAGWLLLLLLLLASNQAGAAANAGRNPPVHNCTCPWSFSLVPVHAVHFSQWREGLFLGAFPTSFHGRFPLYVFMTTKLLSISVGDKQLSGC